MLESAIGRSLARQFFIDDYHRCCDSVKSNGFKMQLAGSGGDRHFADHFDSFSQTEE
jgi:hypothetical protein